MVLAAKRRKPCNKAKIEAVYISLNFSIGFDIVHLYNIVVVIVQYCALHAHFQRAQLHVRCYQIHELIGEICVHGGAVSISLTLWLLAYSVFFSSLSFLLYYCWKTLHSFIRLLGKSQKMYVRSSANWLYVCVSFILHRNRMP